MVIGFQPIEPGLNRQFENVALLTIKICDRIHDIVSKTYCANSENCNSNINRVTGVFRKIINKTRFVIDDITDFFFDDASFFNSPSKGEGSKPA
jgi:hypothetical protein